MDSRLDLLKARMASLEIAEEGNKISRQGGATPGGFHTAHDGTQWYVKRHANPFQAHAEHLANQVYRALGHNAPHSQVLYTHSMRPVYFSKRIEHFQTLHEHEPWRDGHQPTLGHQFLRGAAADSLVANTDMHSANVGVTRGKTITRIDNGATFGLTGQGHEHPRVPHVSHIATYFSMDEDPYQMAFKHSGHDEASIYHPRHLGPQVRDILKLRDKHGGWEGFVNRHVPGASRPEKEQLSGFLKQRTSDLVHHVQVGIEDEKRRRKWAS